MSILKRYNAKTQEWEIVGFIQNTIVATDTDSATATAADIRRGKTAIINGVLVSGTMPDNGAINTTLDGINTTQETSGSGYYSSISVKFDGSNIETLLSQI